MMRVEDARSRSIRDTEKFTRWASLAAERRAAMEAYRDQAEDEARNEYLVRGRVGARLNPCNIET